MHEELEKNNNFLKDIIKQDLEQAHRTGREKAVFTRFPPEPNGYLHIGHAKSICLNFSLAEEFGGLCNLRFDDTNPSKEDQEYIDSIENDVHWLGFDWGERKYFASSYFPALYDFAEQLIQKGLAFVCDLTSEEMRQYRGTLTEPGQNSPYRDRSIAENLDLFRRMRAGEFADGSRVLRAKIDMASPNINLRDPVLYRIMRVKHHRTGNEWPIYPMYDFAHPLSDYLEGITYSVCTLEFEAHRPLYDWVLQALDLENLPHQYEFARLNLTRTVMSKRKLRQLVEEHLVSGWDDPRMPTISGIRRRGYTAASLRDFCQRIGVAKANSLVDSALLEHCIREELNYSAPRVMAVLRPLKLILDNYPEDQVEMLDSEYSPEKPELGSRQIPFSRTLYIEQEDFMEDPPKKFFRLAPGREVRLKNAYIIQCQSVVKAEDGSIVEIHCTYDPETRSGMAQSDRKVKGTLHWVSAAHSLPAEVRIYDHLFNSDQPDEQENFLEDLNPNSLEILTAQVEPSLAQAEIGQRFQFLRMGYFILDLDSQPQKLVFNRIVSLKDTWSKIKNK